MEPLPRCLDVLPLHRAVVERFATRLAPMPGVDAAYISGSVGRDEATAQSDVDLVLVIDSEERQQDFLARAPALISELGDVLTSTVAVHVKPSLWLAVLRGPVLVDLDFAAWDAIEPAPWLRQIVIVKDRDGCLAAIREASQGADGTPYTASWLAGLSERWWRWAFYCAKDNRRGDHLLVLGNYNFLRSNAFSHLFAVLDGVSREYVGRHRDRSRPARLARILAAAGDTPEEWDRTLLRLHDYFLELREEARRLVPHAVPANEAELHVELLRYLTSSKEERKW